MENEIIQPDHFRLKSDVIGADIEEDIVFTNSAVTEIINVIELKRVPDNYFLRFATKSGGCNGMTFSMGFDSRITNADRTYELKKIKIVLDSKSLFYMMGVTVDFVEHGESKGFVFNQPTNFKTCGCHN
ncbi:MAG: iron-sulfur cluster assembly accessory protein [Bacteroidota bacterium]